MNSFNFLNKISLYLLSNVEAYIQSRVLKKTLESISFDRRRNLVEGNDLEGEVEDAVRRLSMIETAGPEIPTAKETTTNG